MAKRDQNAMTGIEFLKPFCLIASVVGLMPYYDFEKRKTTHNTLHKIYCVICCLCIFGLFIYNIITKYFLNYDFKRTTEEFLDITLYILLVVYNLTAVYVASFKHRSLWIMIMDGFFEFDNRVKYKHDDPLTFYLEFTAHNLIVFAVLVADTFVSVTISSWTDFVYYGLERLRLYFIFLPVMSISYLSISLRDRFKFLNDKLITLFWNESISFKLLAVDQGLTKNTHNVQVFQCWKEVENVHDNYSILCGLVQLSNKIFGFHIVLLFGIIVTGILNSINIILIYDTKKNDNFNWANLLLNFLVTLMLLSWGFAVIHFGGSANNEAYRTSLICYQLSSDLQDAQKNEYKRLLLLAQHASDRCPQLSASSVFTLNLAAFFSILGSLTSYVIVLVQFNK